MKLIYRSSNVRIELRWIPRYFILTYGGRVQLGRETSQCSGYCSEYRRLPTGNGGVEGWVHLLYAFVDVEPGCWLQILSPPNSNWLNQESSTPAKTCKKSARKFVNHVRNETTNLSISTDTITLSTSYVKRRRNLSVTRRTCLKWSRISNFQVENMSIIIIYSRLNYLNSSQWLLGSLILFSILSTTCSKLNSLGAWSSWL